MTEEEKEEYRALKYARAEQGFFTVEQLIRWNILHRKHGQAVQAKLERLEKIAEEKRMAMWN